MREKVYDLTVEYLTALSDAPLIVRLGELVEPGPGVRGSAGKPSHSKAPVNTHVFNLLHEIQFQSLSLERDMLFYTRQRFYPRKRDWPSAILALQMLPDLCEWPTAKYYKGDVEKAINRWHGQALQIIGVSEKAASYLPTEALAEKMGMTPPSFRVWASRVGLRPAAIIREGKANLALWDVRVAESKRP